MSKRILAVLSLMFFGSAALASMAFQSKVPAELTQLIPSGSNSLEIKGASELDRRDCLVKISSNSPSSFSTVLAVLDSRGQYDHRRLGSFQAGYGIELSDLQTNEDWIHAVALNKADDQLSKDTRTTLNVKRNKERILSVQIVVEKKGWFGYKAKVNETCIF